MLILPRKQVHKIGTCVNLGEVPYFSFMEISTNSAAVVGRTGESPMRDSTRGICVECGTCVHGAHVTGLEAKWCKFKVHTPCWTFSAFFSEHIIINGFFMDMLQSKRGVANGVLTLGRWLTAPRMRVCIGALYFFRTMFITRSEKLFFSVFREVA